MRAAIGAQAAETYVHGAGAGIASVLDAGNPNAAFDRMETLSLLARHSSRSTSQEQPAGQGRLASTLGGRVLAAASWGRLVCESSNDPRGYLVVASDPQRAARQGLA